MLAVKRQHPDLDIRIVFQKDNLLSRSTKRYSDWAEKYGFIYAIGTIPEEWYIE